MGFFDDLKEKIDEATEFLKLNEVGDFLDETIERVDRLQAKVDKHQKETNEKIDAFQAEAEETMQKLRDWRDRIRELEGKLNLLD